MSRSITRERELAKAEGFDLYIEDHGCLVLDGHFEYGEEGGTCQGLGYIVDVEFLKSFMRVFGVDHLAKVNGKSCWVTHDWDKIYKIEPLRKKEGRPFDVEVWTKKFENK